MVYTGKQNVSNDPTNFDVVVYPGKFRNQGTKVVIQKGTCKISVPLADLLPLINAVTATSVEAAHNNA